MRKRHHFLLWLLFVASIEITFGITNNHTKPNDDNKKPNNIKNKTSVSRNKRALNNNDNENPFWPTRGKKALLSNPNSLYIDEFGGGEKSPTNTKIDNDPPFWGMRGRRSSESIENDYPTVPAISNHFGIICKHCYTSAHKLNEVDTDYSKENESDYENQNSDEIEENNYLSSASLSKTRRQENDPFWGARGRRQEDKPYWSHKMKSEDIPFWGQRGRRFDQDEPFWSSRGRRDTEVNEEPFWGNRGRRQENEPFWGNRGRRQENDPFWGTRGRRRYFEPFHGKQKQQLKKILKEAINTMEENIEHLARFKKDDKLFPSSYWFNRGRNSQLRGLFKGGRNKNHDTNMDSEIEFHPTLSESSTVLNERMYADQPRYIVVERSSRSSAEDDPYFISRGKKKIINFKFIKAARDRRGAIEEIVKSVRNDPYYIARGKKDADLKVGNSTVLREGLDKAKELICAVVDLIMIKKEATKTKRDINDNERDRRTILKKLAAQLQNDPYFVSRGKKSDGTVVHEANLEEFVIEVGEKCNN
ncbi:uncharacterized protein LOC113239537 [Hyposmocoma kahamanoa]|uniref:uncharacterized protein LOC113239537 n=1 Tax=Hyposmocoma kahamanoa TaxID=1477025 RepID=UPI000E6D7F2D|nr:uncharacterized protein LOC113239537 [Hyposmocoma kahamanoa]